MPRAVRLRRKSDIRRTQRQGSRRRTRWFVVLVLPNQEDEARFGLAVSRKVGGAVVRNRVKRRLREAFRQLRPQLVPVDVVVIAHPGAGEARFDELRDALERALARERRVLDEPAGGSG